MPTLTIFTPTYNRANTLIRTYESLCRQTSKDFEWLIVDDGSTDNTEQIVKKWIAINNISIRYIKKENGGLHTGYITAIANIESELNVCIDSDDYMPNDAVENIINEWNTRDLSKSDIGGIIGLDYFENGNPIGGYFKREGYLHLYSIHKEHYGDIKIVTQTRLLKCIQPMKVFKGEKNYNPIYYYLILDSNFCFKVINKNLCFVDYQMDGMSANIFHQYRNSPHSFAELRRVYMRQPYYDNITIFRHCIHYVSSCLFAKEREIIKNSPRPFMTILAIIPGIILNLMVRYKTRKK